jgi:rhodanese-related sulfurtransferase
MRDGAIRTMVENVPPGKTWAALQSNPNAQLVDVRTDAEWNFVGVPDLATLGKQAVLLAWQVYPSMQRNTAFEAQLEQAGFTPEHHIYFLCRSGVRSLAAAEAAQAAGFPYVLQYCRRLRGAARSGRSSRHDVRLESRGPALAAEVIRPVGTPGSAFRCMPPEQPGILVRHMRRQLTIHDECATISVSLPMIPLS